MNEHVTLTRRSLLTSTGAAALTPTVARLDSVLRPPSFRVVHLTDIHVQPELGAPDGLSQCVRKVLDLNPRPDFVLTGGDHVMDLLDVSQSRADLQFALLAERLKPLEIPVYHCVGNHDVYGWASKSSVSDRDPGFGKSLFEEKVRDGKTFYSFDHKGWHFIVLDTIGVRGRQWLGHVDEDQLQWLKNDLEETAKDRPIVVTLHMPIITSFLQETDSTTSQPTNQTVTENGKQVFDLLRTRSVKLVMQGHTHVVESVDYLGTRFMTAGAVCGDWWKGWRLGLHPEGFTVLDFRADCVQATYTSYGWKAKV